MNKKLKIIGSYILLFIESILLLIITMLIVSKFTVLNNNYIKNNLEKNGYYKDLYDEIITEMSYYTNQSGFEDSILDNIFTMGELKYETNKFIENTYKGKSLTIDDSKLRERLTNNINEYIKNSGFKIVDQKEINKFIDTMSETYKDEITLMGYASKGANILTKITSYSNRLIIVIFVAIIILILLNHIVLKRKESGIVFFTASFIILFCNYYFRNNIDLNNLFVYSNLVSKIAKYMINNILSISIIISIIYIVLGLILCLIKKIKKSY